jgi:hypothetical protein
MRTLRFLAPPALLLLLVAISGCGALRSDAVRDLSSSEVEHLKRLRDGLSAASGMTKADTTTEGVTVEVGLAKSLAELTTSWNDLEKSFTRWDEELSRLRAKGLTLTPVPPVGARNGELADLIVRALAQQEKAARAASDFETSCLALAAAEEHMTEGVGRMLEQAKQLQNYVGQSKWSLTLSSLDVAAVGGALGEFEEGRRLLELAGELAPKIKKASGQAGKAVSALGLESETATEIQTLMGILMEKMNSLQPKAPEKQTEDEEETP